MIRSAVPRQAQHSFFLTMGVFLFKEIFLAIFSWMY